MVFELTEEEAACIARISTRLRACMAEGWRKRLQRVPAATVGECADWWALAVEVAVSEALRGFQRGVVEGCGL